MYNGRSARFALPAVVAILIIGLLLVTQGAVFHVGVASLLLLAPGYLIAVAVLPRHADPPERILLMFGCSLGVIILGGLILNVGAWGLQPASWAVLLLLVCIALGSITAYRGGLHRLSGWSQGLGHVDYRTWLPMLIGLLLASSSVWISSTGALSERPTRFVQLWMVARPGASPQLAHIGIRNSLGTASTFELTLTASGVQFRGWHSVTLATGQTFQTSVQLPTGHPSRRQFVLSLFRAGERTAPFRTVSLWR